MWQDFQFTSVDCSRTAATHIACPLHRIITMSQSLSLRHSKPCWEDSLVNKKYNSVWCVKQVKHVQGSEIVQKRIFSLWGSGKCHRTPVNVAVTDVKEWIRMQQEVKVERTFQTADTPCKEHDVCRNKDDQCSSAMCKWSVRSRLWCHICHVHEFEPCPGWEGFDWGNDWSEKDLWKSSWQQDEGWLVESLTQGRITI